MLVWMCFLFDLQEKPIIGNIGNDRYRHGIFIEDSNQTQTWNGIFSYSSWLKRNSCRC